MSNGSFLTSQLPITTNAVPTDRVLILWNAIANASVGSGSPQTMMIAMSDFVNNALTTIQTDIMTSGSLSLGNSTFNTAINSTSLYIQTNTGTVFSVNTSGAINGNGAGITGIGAPGANTNMLFNNSGAIAADSNISWNTATATLTIGNSTVNTTINSVSKVFGNIVVNSTAISVGNAGSIIVGNSTYNTVITPQSITVSNNGNTMWTVNGSGTGTLFTSLIVGNSTVNSVVNSSALAIGPLTGNPIGTLYSNSGLVFANSSVSSQINVTAFSILANSTANAIINASSIVFNGNSTINCAMNTTSMGVGVVGATIGTYLTNSYLTIGNSTVNTTANSTHFFSGNSTVYGFSNSTAEGTVATTGNSYTNALAEVFQTSTGNNTSTATYITIQTNTSSNSILSNTALTFNSNSTVNSVINTTAVSIGVVGATSGSLLNNNQITIGNSTVNTTANSTHFFSGNNTVFGFCNSTAEGIANSTGNSVTTPLSILFQSNTTSNSILSNSSLIFNGNSTVNCSINTTAIAYNGVSQRPVLTVVLTDTALTANANTVAVNAYPAGAQTASLAASTTYLMDGVMILANATAAAAALKLAFGNSAAIGSMAYEVSTMAVNSTVNAYLTTFAISNAATQVTVTQGAAAVSNVAAHIKGTIITSGAVNITPQILYTAACSNTPVMKAGSYFQFTPVTNSSVGTVGTWS